MANNKNKDSKKETQEDAAEFKETSKRKKAREGASNFVNDFRAFAFKGNVIDLAVGVIIGAAFNNIVTSLAKDIIQPPIGKLLGNSSFTDLFINLNDTFYPSVAAADAAGAPVIKYGLFLSNVMNFMITALTLFIILKFVLRQKREEEGDKK